MCWRSTSVPLTVPVLLPIGLWANLALFLLWTWDGLRAVAPGEIGRGARTRKWSRRGEPLRVELALENPGPRRGMAAGN
ncbi:hypothetical protein HS125_13090 [bacterium]|nr:hypothetical protein [bacterium]